MLLPNLILLKEGNLDNQVKNLVFYTPFHIYFISLHRKPALIKLIKSFMDSLVLLPLQGVPFPLHSTQGIALGR